jgi:hypothetical protein
MGLFSKKSQPTTTPSPQPHTCTYSYGYRLNAATMRYACDVGCGNHEDRPASDFPRSS